MITGNITTGTISKALKWLRIRGFIEQEHRTSKQRFKLVYRAFVKASSRIVERAKERTKQNASDPTHSRIRSDHRRKNQRKKPFFYKKNKSFSFKKKNEKGYGRFGSSQNEKASGAVCKAEAVYAHWAINSPTMDIKTLSKAQKKVIVEALQSKEPHDQEWVEVMKWDQSNERVFKALAEGTRLAVL